MPDSNRPAAPSVSIVLLVRDDWEGTLRCLASTIEGARGVCCERIVLDNASADATRTDLPRLEGVVAARSEAPVGRARALDGAAAVARGRHLLFLWPRVELRPGALAPLVAALDADPALAAVGPLLVGPGGAVEAAGLGIARDAPLPITPFPIDHGQELASVRGGAVPALPGACLLVRADAFRAQGGFDERYAEGFEDVDLCLRLAGQGGRMAVVPAAQVVLRDPPDWAELGRHGEDIHRLNAAWGGRLDAADRGAVPAASRGQGGGGPQPAPGADAELDAALARLQATSFRQVQRRGWHFQRNDFYSPLNDCDFLEANRDLWDLAARGRGLELLGVDWNDAVQRATAHEVARYVEELRGVPAEQRRPGEFCWNNSFWNNADALVQYGLVRSRQPRRYVEIGCGWSSLLLRDALARNERAAEVTLVEPYPNAALFAHLPRHWAIHRTILQRAPLAPIEALQPGDVLFYDGSHCAKVASDVNYFFFEVLPRVRPGVLIHLHDVFLPEEYPEEWIFERGQTWNEQYLLRALLMGGSRYRVLIANRYLQLKEPELLARLYAGVQPSYGGSFWMHEVA